MLLVLVTNQIAVYVIELISVSVCMSTCLSVCLSVCLSQLCITIKTAKLIVKQLISLLLWVFGKDFAS